MTDCIEGHENVVIFSHDTYGKNLCLECWRSRGWVTPVASSQTEQGRIGRSVSVGPLLKSNLSEKDEQ